MWLYDSGRGYTQKCVVIRLVHLLRRQPAANTSRWLYVLARGYTWLYIVHVPHSLEGKNPSSDRELFARSPSSVFGPQDSPISVGNDEFGIRMFAIGEQRRVTTAVRPSLSTLSRMSGARAPLPPSPLRERGGRESDSVVFHSRQATGYNYRDSSQGQG